jgi:hypothetical protein
MPFSPLKGLLKKMANSRPEQGKYKISLKHLMCQKLCKLIKREFPLPNWGNDLSIKTNDSHNRL